VLKVINDENLYECEKRLCSKLDGCSATLKLVNAFTFEFPISEDSSKRRQFYFIFEAYQQNII
jgi:hypothetical protein